MNVELSNYIDNMIAKKGLDDFTSSKVRDYIKAHEALYGNFIDTKDVVDRISENLKENIRFNFEKRVFSRGGYSTVGKNIDIYTMDFGEDEYFHEIDHVATSDLSGMPNYEAEDAWDYENIDKRYRQGYKFYVGIEIDCQEPSGPEIHIGKELNEGITVLKQKDYAKLKGIPFSTNGYDINYNMAEQLGYIIGRNLLIKKQFYNDIDGIRDELAKYGIDYDEMLQLMSEFSITDIMSLDFYENLNNPNKGEEFKAKYQSIMTRGFIAKRCKELGITDISRYYSRLSRGQRKIELAELDKFEEFKICDSSALQQVRSGLQPKSLFQKIKDFLISKKIKLLPEKMPEVDEQDKLDEKPKTKSWNLLNWGINEKKFRRESYQVAQDSLKDGRKLIQTEIPKDGETPGDNR